MSVFAKSTPALLPRTDASRKISLLYAGILIVMATAQLFTFEEFVEYVQLLGLPLGEGLTYALVPLLIISEVFALPFLLTMRISPAFRYFSMFLGWLAALLWILLTFFILGMNADVETVGFLGTVVDLTPGWWAAFISLSFGVLAAWSGWGLWPGKHK
jgi:hypothetical protein